MKNIIKKNIQIFTVIACITTHCGYAVKVGPATEFLQPQQLSWWKKLPPQARAGIIAGGAVAGTALAAGGAAAFAGYYLNKKLEGQKNLELVPKPISVGAPYNVQRYGAPLYPRPVKTQPDTTFQDKETINQAVYFLSEDPNYVGKRDLQKSFLNRFPGLTESKKVEILNRVEQREMTL